MILAAVLHDDGLRLPPLLVIMFLLGRVTFAFECAPDPERVALEWRSPASPLS